MKYDYKVTVDTSKFSGPEGDDAWLRDPCVVMVEPGYIFNKDSEPKVIDTNMGEAFDVIHEEHHFDWLNLVLQNDLVGYKLRLSYEVEVQCECGSWTKPDWKCQTCYVTACNESHHNCRG